MLLPSTGRGTEAFRCLTRVSLEVTGSSVWRYNQNQSTPKPVPLRHEFRSSQAEALRAEAERIRRRNFIARRLASPCVAQLGIQPAVLPIAFFQGLGLHAPPCLDSETNSKSFTHHIQLEPTCLGMFRRVELEFVCWTIIEMHFSFLGTWKPYFLSVAFWCTGRSSWNEDLWKRLVLLLGLAFGSSWKERRGFGSHIKGLKVNDFKCGCMLLFLWWATNLNHSLASALSTQLHLMLCD